MKKTTLILTTATMFAIGSTAITSCGSQEQDKKEKTHEHAEEHEHYEGKGVTGDHQEHGEHSHASGGHMQHMNEVREWLKKELGEKYDKPVPQATEEQLAMGKEIYTRICASCHGESGKGDGPAAAALEQKPADFTDPAHSKYYSDQGRIYIIKKGIQGTPMVGWERTLNEQEIQSVYAYVRSLRISEETGEQGHTEGKYACPMHPEITSDEPGKCSKCGMDLEFKKERHDPSSH